VWVECKKSLSEAVALLVLERIILLKRLGCLPWSLVEVWVECKKRLSEAVALLVLERTILLKGIGCPRGVW